MPEAETSRWGSRLRHFTPRTPRTPRWRWLLIALVAVIALALGALLQREARSEPSTEADLSTLDAAIDGSGLERVVETGSAEVTAALALKRELVTAGDDGMVRIWERSSGELLGQTETVVPISLLAETESSSRYLAAVDRRGAVELIDVTDPGRPEVIPLAASLARGERPLAVAYSKESDEIVVLSARGKMLRVNVTTGGVVSRSSLGDLGGGLPWDMGASDLRLTAARFLPEAYEDEEGVLVATTDGAVADLDLGRGQGKTILPAGIAPGRVLSLDRVPYGQPELAVGTSKGIVIINREYGDEPQVTPGAPVPAVAIDAEGLRQGGAEGLLFGESFQRPPSGPAILRFDPGPHGTAVIHPGGSVSVLDAPGVGLSLAESTTTPVAAFDSKDRLLIAEGYDANHIEKVEAVRPRPRDLDEEFPEDEVAQVYRPDPDWWPQAEDPLGEFGETVGETLAVDR